MISVRNTAIDFLRIVLMFFICMIHAVGYADARCNNWLGAILRFSVIDFVLISGYMGVRFSPSKILKLEGLGVVCACIVSLLNGGGGLAVYRSYWFLHAYVLMMCLVPLANICFESYSSSDKRKGLDRLLVALPCIMLVYLWGFFTGVPIVQRFIPRTEGLAPYGGVTLLAVYLIGRCYRVFGWQQKLTWKKVTTVMCCCLLPMALSSRPWTGGAFSRYNSPFVLGCAICVFWVFQKISIGAYGRKIVAYLVPSVFSIYLFHCNAWGYHVFEIMELRLMRLGMNEYSVFLLNAIIAFVGGVLLDAPRRVVSAFLAKPLGWICQMVDRSYYRIIGWSQDKEIVV